MGELFAAIQQFFQDDDWQAARMSDDTVLTLPFSGRNARWVCYARVREEQRQFLFYSVCPINVPENKRHAISEFLARANYGMIMGNFEFDFTDGEIRFKTSIDVEGSELSAALLKNMVYVNVAMLDKYLPGIMSVVYGGVLPDAAIESIEGRPDDEES